MASKADDRNRDIYDKCQAGITYQAIADEYGLSRQRVEQIYRQHGGPGRKPNPKQKPREPGSEAHRLAVIRERLFDGLNQRQFAELLGVPVNNYGHWENGRTDTPRYVIKKLIDTVPGRALQNDG